MCTMGFDLTGVEPKNKKGEYFRNNCWWWRPLWDFIGTHCNDIITSEDLEKGCYNDGHLIDGEKAKRLAFRLEFLINQGIVKKYQEKYEEEQKNTPDEKCDICNGTGKRNDIYVKGTCNACGGKGTKRPWICSYPFSIDNVKEFVDFCKSSGGFQIY